MSQGSLTVKDGIITTETLTIKDGLITQEAPRVMNSKYQALATVEEDKLEHYLTEDADMLEETKAPSNQPKRTPGEFTYGEYEEDAVMQQLTNDPELNQISIGDISKLD